MRACSGTWIAHGSGTRRPRDRRRARPGRRAAGQPAYTSAPHLADREEDGLLLRLLERRPLAALPHRARAPGVPRRRLGALPRGQPKFADAVVAEARSDDPIVLVQDYHFALLPRMIRAAPAGGDGHHVLAHPVAEPRGVRDLPVARRAARRPARQRPSSASTRSPLQQLPRDGRPLPGGAHRSRDIHRDVRRQAHRGRAAIRSRSSGRPRRSRVPGRDRGCRERCARASAAARTPLGVGVDRLDYTKGILERFQAVERLLELQPEWIGRFTFVQIAAPTRARIAEYQDRSRSVRAVPSASTSASPAPASADLLLAEHHEPDARLRVSTAPPTSAS